jgi:hypothetical protein
MSAGVGKASEEMIKELQKAQKQEAQEQPGKSGGEHHVKFEQALQNHAQVNEAQNLAKIQEASKPGSTIQAAKSGQLNASLQANQSQKTAPVERPANGAFSNVVKELSAGQNKLEGLMKVAMSGQKLSNQEMIGIQAGVYMYSQQMELTSKVIDKATSGIKQAMNTQV